MSLIIDCQLFPCIYYIKKLTEFKHVKIEAYESYQKMSFRNRYIIAGANGLQSLTIPVRGGRKQKTPIREVLIDNSTDWRTKHWRGLLSAYRKAPFFDYYAEDIKDLIFYKEDFLFFFNIKILEWLYKVLKINLVIEFTEWFVSDYEDETDARNYFKPNSFQHLQNDFKHYFQVFEDRIGFQPNLSIIDLILCEGPNAVNLIHEHS